MRPVEFIFSLIDKFAPMNEVDKAELRTDANNDYLAIRKEFDELKGEKPSTLKLRLIKYSEHWVVRTMLAVLFIYIAPKVQNYYEGGGNYDDDGFDDFEIVE